MAEAVREIQCTEVWGGTGPSDVSVKLAGVRGEVFAQPHEKEKKGGDIHFLSVCGMSILSKVVLADVSGHGAESASVAQIIHEALIENIGAHDNSSMLRQVNDTFLERRKGDFRFTTMVSMIVDSRDRSLVYAYAGHPSILRGERKTGRFRRIEPEAENRGGFPLGIVPGTSYEQYAVDLEEGDVLVAYTDAFIEADHPELGRLGVEGLCRILEGADAFEPARLKAHVLETLGDHLDDDASIVVLEVL